MKPFRFVVIALLLVPIAAIAQDAPPSGDAAKSDPSAQLNVVHHPATPEAEPATGQPADLPRPSIMWLKSAAAPSSVVDKHIVANSNTPLAAGDVTAGVFGSSQSQGNAGYSFAGVLGVGGAANSGVLLTASPTTSLSSTQSSAVFANAVRDSNNGNWNLYGIDAQAIQAGTTALTEIDAGYFAALATGIGQVDKSYGVHVQNLNGAYGVHATDNVAVQIDDASNANAANNYAIRYSGTAGVAGSPFAVRANGSVGIGTTAPTTKLTIQPPSYDTATDGIKFLSSDNSTHCLIQPIKVTSGAMNLFLGSNAYVSIGGQNLRFDATTDAASASAYVNIRSNDGTIRFATSPTGADPSERMYIGPNGNVGIGTTTPNNLLAVVGSSPKVEVKYNTYVGANTVIGSLAFTGGSPNYSDSTTSANPGAVIQAVSEGSWTQYLPTALTFSTTRSDTANYAERMRITNSGTVGIGLTSPNATLDVNGSIHASGAITGATVIGSVYQDLAEWVPASEKMDAGTVVVLNREKNNEVTPSTTAYDTGIAGVVSSQPGFILGVADASKAQIATTGRVRVKVDASRQPIKVGDLLVTSDRSGLAMKSIPLDLGGVAIHRPGTLIGKALEPLASGQGEILVLLSLQ